MAKVKTKNSRQVPGNIALEMWYRNELLKMLDKISKATEREIEKVWKNNTPKMTLEMQKNMAADNVQDAHSHAVRTQQFSHSHPTGDKVVSLMPSLRGLEKWTAEQLQVRANPLQDARVSVALKCQKALQLVSA